ncbi:1-hydroxy-2-methyl-2-butenyl 4-diphosphate reductase [Streptomyces sp. NPDC005805]|uniref:phosphorylase family protein n=1 Tax=Streptomyces sp. NPDC005805 TaxID=3157068 RepID=UPI0033DF1737
MVSAPLPGPAEAPEGPGGAGDRAAGTARGADGAGSAGAAVPLLVACALGIERFALRAAPGNRGRGAPEAPRATVLRTGMGPESAARAVLAACSTPELREAAVIASGFCAGLVPGMHPGDVVVADETLTDGTAVTCANAGLLRAAVAAALPGRTVHGGVLLGADHVVRGPERARLEATGAIAVDMESATTLATALSAGPRAVAAVRVVVDAPEHELVRISTLRGGISAFRVLRALMPAFYEWRRSLLLPRR